MRNVDDNQQIRKKSLIVVGAGFDKRINEESFSLCKLLRDNGYGVVVAYPFDEVEYYGGVNEGLERLKRDAKIIGCKTIESMDSDMQSVLHAMLGSKIKINLPLYHTPRDIITQIGEVFYVLPEIYTRNRMNPNRIRQSDIYLLIKTIVKNKNFPIQRIKESPWAEGGRWIDFDDFVIASSELKRKLRIKSRDYRFDGKKVYFVENMRMRVGSKKRTPEEIHHHIDYAVNGLNVPEKGTFVVVDKKFYDANRPVFSELERKEQPEIVFVSEDEASIIPANFLVLPDRKVVLSKEARKTNSRIYDKIGEAVIGTCSNSHYLAYEKGLRCRTNVFVCDGEKA